MKNLLLPFFILITAAHSFAQPMHVKHYNFTSFGQDRRMDVTLLNKESSDLAKKHPEYGIRPYNAQCDDCVELPDQRTANSRQFIKVNNSHRTYSQQSYLPLHYKKSENDIWRTIDYRLRPDADNPGVYAATNQPVPTKCDLNRKLTSINESGFEFEFNKNLTIYFYDDNIAYTTPQKGDYSQYTIGEEGLEVKNMWKGIDMQQIFSTGQVESNFIINAPLQLPISKGWMVIEDHFSLPVGMSMVESPEGKHLDNGFYQGDYLIKDVRGETLITYKMPTYTDAIAFAMHGMYNLIKTGNDYTMKIMVPVSWLSNKNNTYPITIDPIIFGKTKIGEFQNYGLPSADLGFTTKPGSCDYHMIVVVPGNSQLTDVYADIEYELTYDNTCGNPHEAAPYCTFSQVSMSVVSDTCHVSTGPLSCQPASPPFTGTCTTDSNLVPLASSIHVNQYWPDFISCFAPQCPDFYIPFTLKDQDSICGDVCGYLCARGNIWQMTVYACQVEGYISPDSSVVCAGQPDTLTVHADCGVPPYRYAWTTDGGNTYDIIYDSPYFIIHPQQNMIVSCIIYDSCWKPWQSNASTALAIPGPVIQRQGNYLSTTTSDTLSYQWYLNGSPLPGDTTATIQITQDGAYSVQVSSVNGCNKLSVPYVTTGVINLNDDGNAIIIVPNPSDGNFEIRFTSNQNISKGSLKILDNLGRQISTRQISVSNGNNTYSFHPDIKLASGEYWIEITVGGATMHKKFIVL